MLRIKIKSACLLLSCSMFLLTLNAQNSTTFNFESITFHSRLDDEKSSDVSVNIYSNKKIEVARTIYRIKGQVDTTLSGTFKGVLKDKDYSKLIKLLKQSNLDTLKFPKVECCGMPLKILIVSYNGESKKFKSMTPPNIAEPLINFLTSLSATIILPRYKGGIDFEE